MMTFNRSSSEAGTLESALRELAWKVGLGHHKAIAAQSHIYGNWMRTVVMLAKDIPDQMSVKSPPFTGVYKKRRMKSKDLYCWFNIEDDVIFPHVSLHINDDVHRTFKDFHITFPILHRGGWDNESTRKSFSIHYQIAGGSINLCSVTETQHIRRVDAGGMNYQTMKDESKLLALRFVRAAMVQSALA